MSAWPIPAPAMFPVTPTKPLITNHAFCTTKKLWLFLRARRWDWARHPESNICRGLLPYQSVCQILRLIGTDDAVDSTILGPARVSLKAPARLLCNFTDRFSIIPVFCKCSVSQAQRHLAPSKSPRRIHQLRRQTCCQTSKNAALEITCDSRRS